MRLYNLYDCDFVAIWNYQYHKQYVYQFLENIDIAEIVEYQRPTCTDYNDSPSTSRI